MTDASGAHCDRSEGRVNTGRVNMIIRKVTHLGGVMTNGIDVIVVTDEGAVSIDTPCRL